MYKKILTFIKEKSRWLLRKFFLFPPGLAWYYKVLWRIGNLLVIGMLCMMLVDMNFLWLFGKSPRIRHIYNPEMKITSELYSADGVMLAQYFDENRTPMKYEEIPSQFLQSLIATEDNRFYQHHGIDFKAALSVFWYMAKGEKRGGSTITQQLVKNLFKTRSDYSRGLLGRIPGIKVLVYKTKEWNAALKLEFLYTKEEILTMYINTIDFGSQSFGLKTACKRYFNKAPKQMLPEETALLIGLLKAPSYYSPVTHPKRAAERRNVVLQQMCKAKIIEPKVCDSLLKLPLKLHYLVEATDGTDNNYIREAVSNYLKSWLKESGHDLYTDGLKIFCTIDSRLQQYAEEAVSKQMKKVQKRFFDHWEGQNPWTDRFRKEIPNYIENIAAGTRNGKRLATKYKDQPDSIIYYMNLPRPMKVFSWDGDRDTLLSFLDSIRYSNHLLHAGFMAMSPQTGQIKVWVGGINSRYFKFDHIRQSKRQPGSTFKAFVYAAAMDTIYGPCDTFFDEPVTFTYEENGETKRWYPRNAQAVFTGEEVTLKAAFAQSINSVAVQLTKILGWRKVIQYAYKMGIRTKLQDVPSVCLGSSDVSLYELIDAYCPFVNGGYRIEPILVTRIEDHDGNVVYSSKEDKERVLSEETSFYMQTLLQSGLREPGSTVGSLYEYDVFRFNTDFGGKTGTSSNHSDGWFIGVTPGLVAGAWVGGESRHIHFKSGEQGDGNKTALPIYGYFMEQVTPDKRYRDLLGRFPKPKVKLSKPYGCHTLRAAGDSLQVDSTAVMEDLGLPE